MKDKILAKIGTIFYIFVTAVLILIIVLLLLNPEVVQAQTKKPKVVIKIDSVKFLRYHILGKDTIKVDSLTVAEQHQIRMKILLKKKKK